MSETPVIGLTMIVRDEAATIQACLASVAPHVDRILIHDTGSTDATADLCEQAFAAAGHSRGTAVVRRGRAWPGDFGAARQAALDDLRATFPEVTHILWVDGDDLVAGGEHLRALASAMRPPLGALLMHYAYAHDPSGNLACSHYRERLVNVDAVDRWQGAVHEVLVLKPGWVMHPCPAPETSGLRSAGAQWPTDAAGIEVIHTRPPAKDTTGRNRRILEAELAAADEAGRDPDPRVLFYLAQEQAITGGVERDRLVAAGETAAAADALREHLTQAIATLERYDALSGWDQERYQARHRRADFHRALGEHRQALAVDLAAIELLPDWPDAWHGAAESYLHLGNPAAAVSYTDAGLGKPYPQTMLILNPLDYTCAPHATRGLALHALGRTDEALNAIRAALTVTPHDDGLRANEAMLMRAVNEMRVRDAVLALDEALARHDENLKAARLLEGCVPYFLVDDPVIADRRNRRRRGVRHVRGGDYTRFYQVDNPVWPIVDTLGGDLPIPDRIRGFCDRLPRAQFLRRQLEEIAGGTDLSQLTVTDVGCNDGWLGWWLVNDLGVGGYHGWDLSREAIQVARGYAEHYPRVASERIRFDEGVGEPEGADVVVCFEVLEHVPDAGEHLQHLAALGRDGCRVVISTPRGAWELGAIGDWDSPEPRGHVRALRSQDVAALILDHGDVADMEETPDRLVCAAWTPRERKGRLDMYLGPAAELWAPFDTLTKGLGGSETMAVRMATRLAERGWRVRLYGEVHPACVQQVEYLPHHLFDPCEPRDVLIASRRPDLITLQPEGRRRILWLHDADYPDLERHAAGWDEVWCVGRWQADHLPLGDADVRVTRNGIPLDRYPHGGRGFEDREPALIYSSSPDRGLVNVLEAWPEIREACQARGVEPRLHITYGFTGLWRAMEPAAPHLADVRRQVEDAMAMPGVVWHGGVGQERLADLQQAARVWWYPTDFPEVSCITGMEAQAAGLAILTSRYAELPYTVGSHGDLMARPADWTPEIRDQAVRRVVDLLTKPSVWGAAHERALRGAHRFSADELADEWDAWLTSAAGVKMIRVAVAAG